MITLSNVSMNYPLPRHYWDFVTRPLAGKRFFSALTDVNLKVRKGERIALLGPNGAGKTTLLKLIGGLLLPSRGTVLVNGCDTLRDNTGARKSVGFVMNEERSFFWRISGRQNLEFFGALDNLHGRELKERIDQLVELVGLEDAITRTVSTYSSGMKQRLAMARGLIAEPDILILDEPTRTLDPVACDELIDLILNKISSHAGKTLLIATHRLEEASRLCDRVLVINKSRMVSFDSLADLSERGISLPEHYKNCVRPVVECKHAE